MTKGARKELLLMLKKVVSGDYSYIIKQFDQNDSILFEYNGTVGYCWEGAEPGDSGTVIAC